MMAACIISLSELEWLPVAYVEPSATTIYVAQLLSVAMAVGGCYAALRMFAFPRVKARIVGLDREEALRAYAGYALLRSAIIAVAICGNAVIYYAVAYDGAALYCLLISLTASLFCWPSLSAFRDMRLSNTAAK